MYWRERFVRGLRAPWIFFAGLPEPPRLSAPKEGRLPFWLRARDRVRRLRSLALDRRPDVYGLGGLLVLAALVVGLHVTAFGEISPIDELSHFDSVVKAGEFTVVRPGDTVGEVAMREEACRGFAREDDPIPSCETPELHPEFFQDFGYNTAATKFPIYHFITGITARLVRAVTPIDSLLTAARLLGAVWLAGALAVSWLLLGELGASRPARVVALALMITTPIVIHMSSIINTDSVLLFTGASIAYSIVLWERGRLHAAIPVAVAVTALVLETTNLVAVGLACGYLAARSVQRRQLVRHAMAMGGALAILAVAVGLGYSALHDRVIGSNPAPSSPETQAAYQVAYRPPEIQNYSEGERVPVERIVGEIDALVTPVRRPYIPPVLAGVGTSTVLSLLNMALIGGVISIATTTKRGSRAAALAVATAIVMLGVGPLLAWDHARRDVFFAIPPRFGLPILPVVFGFLALMLRKRVALGAVAVLATWSVANVVYKLAA